MSTQNISYKYRIYPKQKQIKRIFTMFNQAKEIHNELIALNVETYKSTGKGLIKFDYARHTSGRSKTINLHSQTIQNIADRVHKSFQNFFGRIKRKEKEKGFPRMKKYYKSITYPQSGFKFLNDKHLFVSKIGNIPIVFHRIMKGNVKIMTVKRNRVGQWFVFFSNEIEIIKVKHPSKEQVGIDVGLESFATLSNRERIENPRFLIRSEKRLKTFQRRLSRKKKGSSNRRKSKFRVARIHQKIFNQRTDFLHQQSVMIVKKFSIIAVEQLNISGMVRNHRLAKHINDASWGSFLQMLSYKAVMCGGEIVENTKTRGSSKRCSHCGTEMEMPLSKRTFNCLNCGLSIHRDLNASLNMLRDTVGLTEINACGDNVRPSVKKAVVVEAGTKYESA